MYWYLFISLFAGLSLAIQPGSHTGKMKNLLAQSYMPAQDIHVLNNPRTHSLNPWYVVKSEQVITPE